MPYAKEWLDIEAATGGRTAMKGTPDEIKAQYAGLIQVIAAQTPPPSENVDVKDEKVDEVSFRINTPKGEKGPFPIGIYTHGGGFMVGAVKDEDFLTRLLSEHTKTVIISVDYRLSPEHKWPTQLEDTMKVYKWAHKNASSFGGDSHKMFTIGASSGGAIALAVANQVKRDAQLKDSLKGIAAVVPNTCHWEHVPSKYQHMYKSYTDNATDVPLIDKESLEMFYREAAIDPKDSTIFTVHATDIHKAFPPTYFASCEYDPLRDDTYIMEKALTDAGVPTKHDHYPGLPHYFWIFPSLPQGQQFVQNLMGGIGWLTSKM